MHRAVQNRPVVSTGVVLAFKPKVTHDLGCMPYHWSRKFGGTFPDADRQRVIEQMQIHPELE